MENSIESICLQLRFKEAQSTLRFYISSDYLSQHAEPSEGCAQHAPPLSSGFSLGVQHTDAFFLGVQHDEAGVCSFFSLVALLFFNTGISVCVSIVKVFHL